MNSTVGFVLITEDFNCEIDSDLVDGVIVKEVFSAGWQTSASGLRIVASSLHLPVINLFFFGTVGKTVPLEQHHINKHVKIPEPVNGWLRAKTKKAKAPCPKFGLPFEMNSSATTKKDLAQFRIPVIDAA